MSAVARTLSPNDLSAPSLRPSEKPERKPMMSRITAPAISQCRIALIAPSAPVPGTGSAVGAREVALVAGDDRVVLLEPDLERVLRARVLAEDERGAERQPEVLPELSKGCER